MARIDEEGLVGSTPSHQGKRSSGSNSLNKVVLKSQTPGVHQEAQSKTNLSVICAIDIIGVYVT